jgi:hypothetical protein
MASQLGVQVDRHLREQFQAFVLQKSGSFAAKQLLIASIQKASNFFLAKPHNAFDHPVDELVAGVEDQEPSRAACTARANWCANI